jgi:hypothetical protein
MRLLIKACITVLAVIGVSGYAGYLMTGKFPWQGLKMPTLSTPDVKTILPKPAGEPPQLAYKWQDAQGSWHYSNEPPPEGITAQEIKLDKNRNVMAATPVPVEAPEVEDKTPESGAEDKKEEQPFLYSPEGIKQVMDKARDVQKQMNERSAAQQEALENL